MHFFWYADGVETRSIAFLSFICRFRLILYLVLYLEFPFFLFDDQRVLSLTLLSCMPVFPSMLIVFIQ